MERGGRVNEGGEFNGFLTADYFFYKFLSAMFLELWNLDSRVSVTADKVAGLLLWSQSLPASDHNVPPACNKFVFRIRM